MIDAFRVVDDVLLQTVQGIIDLIATQGLINLDFADIRSMMKDAGPAVIGLGRGSGEHRATEAARQAIASPLLEASIDGARGILFNVSGPADLGLAEVRLAADEIRARADADANVIFGASLGELGDDDVIHPDRHRARRGEARIGRRHPTIDLLAPPAAPSRARRAAQPGVGSAHLGPRAGGRHR